MRRLPAVAVLLVAMSLLACSGGAPEPEGAGGDTAGVAPESRVAGDSAVSGMRGVLPGLFGIMAGLQNDMARIDRGLWLGRLDTIAAAARSVADHAAIPADEVDAVASVLGAEMSRFQEMDVRVHDDAVRLADAAGREDLDAVLEAQASLRRGCVECHRTFRERLRAEIR